MIIRLVYMRDMLNYLREMYIVTQKLKDQMKKSELNQDCPNNVKRHHPTTKIIGDKDAQTMTRKSLRNNTCLLSMKEPKIVKDA